MRLSKRCLLAAAALLGSIAVVLPTIASAEPLPVEAVNELTYYHHWSNPQQTIMAGEEVKFGNPYSTFPPHGLKFTSGPTPICTGIPVAATEASGDYNWHGQCKFSTSGTYTFVCTVHPLEMKGTITVKNIGEPIATTEEAALVGETEATLKGTVNPQNKLTSYFFNYGLSIGYDKKTSPQSAEGTSDVAASALLRELAPGTTYHYQLVAENSAGVVHGDDQTFTTVGPPIATTGIAGALSETGATLKGTVNPDGRPTEYFFEWGTGTAYGQVSASVQAGQDHSGHVASTTLASLSPATLYHFRLVARNSSAQIAFGADQTFTTLSPPTTTTQTTSPSTTTLLAPPPKLEALPILESTPVSALKLTAPRHATSVRGALVVGQAGAGGTLAVDVLAKGTSLGRARGTGSRSVRVGHLLRKSVTAGKLSFAVSLSALAKRALARRHSLAVTVRITLTPALGRSVTLVRSVTLRA
jgi:hypothetical protein